jgi:hypothetical protein
MLNDELCGSSVVVGYVVAHMWVMMWLSGGSCGSSVVGYNVAQWWLM